MIGSYHRSFQAVAGTVAEAKGALPSFTFSAQKRAVNFFANLAAVP